MAWNSIKGLLDLIIKIINVGQARKDRGNVHHLKGHVPSDRLENHKLGTEFLLKSSSNLVVR